MSFLRNVVQRRLSSWLEPWVQEEPNLDVSLGFRRSRAIARNLRLDVAVFNELLDGTFRFSFQQIAADLLTLRFSAWSAPAFSVEVHGLHVKLSARAAEEGSSARVCPSLNGDAMEMKKALSSLDPEGCSLHDLLEKMLFPNISNNQLKTSLLNLILGHCRIRIVNLDLQLQCLGLNDSLAYSLRIMEVDAMSRDSACGCLLMGILQMVFLPRNESSFVVDGTAFEVGYQRNGVVNHVCSANELSLWIKSYCLQLIDLILSVPELKFFFSPSDVPTFLKLEKLSSKEYKNVRSGKQLWNLAANRIGYMTSHPRSSWQKLVGIVILWLRYVIAYEHLLLSIGFSSDKSLKSSLAIMFENKAYCRSAREKWDTVCSIEKELPAEAIAQARRVARHRALLNVHCADCNHRNSLHLRLFHYFFKIFSILAYIWMILHKTFQSMTNIYFSREKLTQDIEYDDSAYSSFQEFQVTISLLKVSIVIYLDHSMYPKKLENGVRFPFSDITSFCLSVDKILVMHAARVSERSLSISCGELKIKSSSLGQTTRKDGGTKDTAIKGRNRIDADNFKTILHTEPASLSVLSERNKNSDAGTTDGTRNLETFLAEVWSDWKRGCLKFERKTEIKYSGNPCLLCEIKSFLRYSGENKQDTGCWKCSMVVGKLNIALGYSSMLSIILISRQIQCAQDLIADQKCPGPLSYSSHRVKNRKRSSFVEHCELYSDKLKVDLLSLIPEKYIELGIYVAGPHLEITKDKGAQEEDMKDVFRRRELQVVFDLHDIELAAWPILCFDKSSASDTVETDSHLFQKLHKFDIPEPYNERYVSQGWICLRFYLEFHGLNASVCNKEENQQAQIFVFKPANLRFLSMRTYVYTFGLAMTAFSSALNGVATGVSIISCMEDLDAFFQLIRGPLPAISDFCCDSEGDLCGRELMTSMPVQHGNSEVSSGRKPLIGNLFVINATFELQSVDVILLNSRPNKYLESLRVLADSSTSKNIAPRDLTDLGVWSSVLDVSLELFCEERRSKFTVVLSEFQSILFNHRDYVPNSTDHINVRSVLLESRNCLCEISVSSCKFKIRMDHPRNSSPSVSDSVVCGDTSTTGNTIYAQGDPSCCAVVRPTEWIVINIGMSEVYMARGSARKILMGARQSKKLLSSLYIGRDFQSISCEIQGGFCLFEPVAVAMFLQVCSSYVGCIQSMFSTTHSAAGIAKTAEHGSGISEQNDHPEFGEQTVIRAQQVKWETLEAFSLNVSRCAFGFLGEDESGLRELILEMSASANLESSNISQNFAFELSHASIFSQILEDAKNEINIPHFSSPLLTASSSVSGVSVQTLQQCSGSKSFDDAGLPGNTGSWESAFKNLLPQEFFQSYESYILKNLGVLLSIHKSENSHPRSNQGWAGRGSVSGFHLNISLSELRVILSMLSSFSGMSSGGATCHLPQTRCPSNHEGEECLEAAIPDGAVVAILDVHQHLYVTVEDQQNKYTLGGVLHHSLVGERSLFKIQYHKHRRWRSSVLWFSLTSLYAKSNEGKPLQLCYNPGSSLVDISGANGSALTLWRMLSCKFENYRGDTDWEPYYQLVKQTFYLVNKKSDCGVAFVNGSPEFVNKPGNPFKLKLVHDIGAFGTYPMDTARAVVYSETVGDEVRTSVKFGGVPCISITVEEVSIALFDELLTSKDRLPLFRGSIDITQLTVQILPIKTRIMSILKASLCYFDAQKNLWRDFIHPVGVSIFCRSSFQTQGSENSSSRMPVCIYCRADKFNISLTELSLDMLLFGIGKLDLAGPFLVKSSTVLANCCKVENCSGLDLLCTFDEKQNVTIGRRQFAFVYLRLSASRNQSSEAAVVVSVQLSLGNFTTSPILVSLLETRTLAWKTRIVSSQDSRSYPGPFIVVDMSKRPEDGLSMVVSPLTRMHNETEFSIDLRIQRPDEKQDEFAFVVLKPGDSVDDSMATFDAVNLSGVLKKALTSLAVGNFIFSFRPETPEDFFDSKRLHAVEWSEELKGGKAVPLSGIFEKLSYSVRSALSIESMKCSFSTAYCAIKAEDTCLGYMHFLIQRIGRSVPIVDPEKVQKSQNLPIALIEQKDIYILPTLRVSNFLSTEIDVLLTETDQNMSTGCDSTGKRATIKSGGKINFYVNPTIIYFSVTLPTFGTSCRPVNSGEWVKKLHKNRYDAKYLDVDLDFDNGKYYTLLRLSRGIRGILEAAVFSLYTLKNESDSTLLFFAPNRKPLSRQEAEKINASIPPDVGLYLPPKSTQPWFLKSHKTRVQIPEGCVSTALLDLGVLSGLSEIGLEIKDESGVKCIKKFGLSVKANPNDSFLPSQMVIITPRYLVLNESKETIVVRQCYLEDDSEGMPIESSQGTPLQLQDGINNRREFSIFEKFIRKHGSDNVNLLVFIQFRLIEPESAWSGPVCITSIGRFFLKFKREKKKSTYKDKSALEFASAIVAEEGSTLTVRFQKPPIFSLPYRIENCLRDASLTYYQKDSSDAEVLQPGSITDYVWDDLTLPHKLVVLVNDLPPLREIRLDKVRPWKPFFNFAQQRGLATHLPLKGKSKGQTADYKGISKTESVKLGYEVYADGPTRVLRISEYPAYQKNDATFRSRAKIQFRLSHVAIHLLEHRKQDFDKAPVPSFMPILVARLENIGLDSVFSDEKKYNQICVQSLNIDHKWEGAPYAAMLRRHRSDYHDKNDYLLKIVFVVLSSSIGVTQIRYCSIILQPVDLNLDEETLMRILPFWRTSLSSSSSPSRQFYFDHFEVHPVKIITNFLPGDSFSSYNSAQETLRSLLHSVVKVPPIKNMVVELNGVLVTHALITVRELLFRCAQHYTWYAMRAVYIAKGSPLLPPAFASIFDDLASSSLDAFFDPSRGLTNLPGFTLGTFKLLSKCIDREGFSGTKRYFGDLGKTLRTAGSNVLFAAVAEISDSILKGAENKGFDGVVSGFHRGVLKLAMEPSLLGTALLESGSDRTIKLKHGPGVDELYVEGYLQAMLDTNYRQEFLKVKVVDDQVYLKNLPPNNTLINEIMDRVKGYLISKGLLEGDPSAGFRPLRHLQGEREWKFGPAVLTLCEHLFVNYVIGMMKKQASKLITHIKPKKEMEGGDDDKAIVPVKPDQEDRKVRFLGRLGIGKFIMSSIIAYMDGRLCRCIPNPIARRIVSGFLLSFLDKSEDK